MIKTVPDQPDELAGRLQGMADSFTRGNAFRVFGVRTLGGIALVDLGFTDARLLEVIQQDRQEIVCQRDEVRLHVGSSRTRRPRLLLTPHRKV